MTLLVSSILENFLVLLLLWTTRLVYWCLYEALEWCELTPANTDPLLAEAWKRLQLETNRTGRLDVNEIKTRCFQSASNI